MTGGWLKAMDLLLRRGPLGVDDAGPLTAAQAEAAIAYTFDHLNEPTRDGFCWADQIRSPAGLREKYERLRDARRQRERTNGHSPSWSRDGSKWDPNAKSGIVTDL